MALSPNYGWAEPDNSSLVKNGASDIRTLGDAIDTSVWNVGYGQAGKNKIINGAMDIWQRGTSFTTGYTADRWQISGGTSPTVVRSTDTPNASFTYSASLGGSNYNGFLQSIESANSILLVGSIATLSFWAKSGTGANLSLGIDFKYANAKDNFSSQTTITSAYKTITTSWVRYTATVTAANMSSNVANGLQIAIYANTVSTGTFLITGVQLEVGSTATPFSRNASSIQGELATCQRYYQRANYVDTAQICAGQAISATVALASMIALPVQMRVVPTTAVSNVTHFKALNAAGGAFLVSSNVTNINSNVNSVGFGSLTVATGLVAGNATTIFSNNANCYVEMSAEL